MTVYIVRPKETAVSRSLSRISRKLAPEKRQAQIEEVITLQQEDSTQQAIQAWLKDAQADGVKTFTPLGEIGAMGTMVVEMGDEQADQMRQDLPQAYVLADQPIELIKPLKSNKPRREEYELAKTDLWHIAAVGLEPMQQEALVFSGQGIGVAVLDTGINSSHPAFTGKAIQGYTLDVPQWQVTVEKNALDTDLSGHGTHVAGLIAGYRVGVAPGANLLSVVILPGGSGSWGEFVLALEWVAQQPNIQIVNISAGFRGYFPQMDELIPDLLPVGTLPVCAVGNDGRNRTCSPGNYRDVLSIGAANDQGRIASFSSSGTLTVNNHIDNVPDLVAPGEAIYSAVPAGGYEAFDGTSMAAPIASGIAALILEEYPDMTVADLREELLLRCKDLQQPTERQGRGLIQAKFE